jgi:hypothetical protein
MSLFAVFVTMVAAGAAFARPSDIALPPSPYAILGSDLLDPPRLEAIPVCIPARLSVGLGDFEKAIGEQDFEAADESLSAFEATIAIQDPAEREKDLTLIRAALAARRAADREQRVAAQLQLEDITKHERDSERLGCALIESARILVALDRLPEAYAATRRISKQYAWQGDAHPLMTAARFFDAEILYRRGEDFNAHLAYREIAGSKNPRIAAAARLRLTDLSFDAGKSRPVQLEYETLLPHGAAFGARMTDWALRASEAALDAGDFSAVRAWFDRHADEIEDRDARDVAEIRRADLDALEGRPDEAFKRLRGLFGRKGRPDVEALAKVRSVDLGVSSASPDRRIAELHNATATPNRRVRVYALSVLVHELLLLGRLDEGVAAVTRLAYEGANPVLARYFEADVAALLERTRLDARDGPGCRRMIRRLGGRYGILMNHASDAAPFLALGRCFERLNFNDLAVALYRTLPRVFGLSAARQVALPLARTSLAAGEPAMARAAAQVNLRHDDVDAAAWRALLARAEAALGHADKARTLLRGLLSKDAVPEERVELALLFAQLIDGRPHGDDTRLLMRALDAIPEARQRQHVAAFSEANMRAAQILRRQGRLDDARRYYRIAAAHLTEGSRKREALYWTGQSPASAGEVSDGTGKAGDPADGRSRSAWTRLAVYDETTRGMSAKHALPGGR